MKPTTNAQAAPKIDITKTIPVKCDNTECENDIFMSVMKFRKVPKLLTGSTEDQLVPIQIFICTACGNVNREFDFNG